MFKKIYIKYRTRAIISRSWIQAIHKDRIFWKNLLKNKEMVFGNGVKNIQAAAYNGARTVFKGGNYSRKYHISVTLVKLRSLCRVSCLIRFTSTIRIWWALPLLEPSHKSIPKCDNDQSVPFQLQKHQSTSASPNNSLHTNQATYSIHLVLEWIFALWYPSNFDQELQK